MRIRVDDPALLPDLIETLRERMDVVIDRHGDELAVSVLGSIGQEHLQAELEQRVRGWRLRHPDVQLEIDAGCPTCGAHDLGLPPAERP
jgi:hypothetical protein